jgi:hypothetical protein
VEKRKGVVSRGGDETKRGKKRNFKHFGALQKKVESLPDLRRENTERNHAQEVDRSVYGRIKYRKKTERESDTPERAGMRAVACDEDVTCHVVSAHEV